MVHGFDFLKQGKHSLMALQREHLIDYVANEYSCANSNKFKQRTNNFSMTFSSANWVLFDVCVLGKAMMSGHDSLDQGWRPKA